MPVLGYDGNKGSPLYWYECKAVANQGTADEIWTIFHVQAWNPTHAADEAKKKLDTTAGDWRVTHIEECNDPRL